MIGRVLAMSAAMAVSAGSIAVAQQPLPSPSPTPPPPPRVVAFDSLELVARPNMALRVTVAQSVKGLAGAGDPVNLECRLQAWGRLACSSGDDPLRRAAVRLAGGYRFKSIHSDDAPDAVIVTEVTLQVAPGPPVDIDPAGKTVLEPVSAAWAKIPSANDFMLHYPEVYQRKALGGRVTATCRILDDLSVYCPVVKTPPDRELLERSVRQLVPLFRSEPKLKTGQPAAGAWIGMAFVFVPT
jgi:hypothetical protein